LLDLSDDQLRAEVARLTELTIEMEGSLMAEGQRIAELEAQVARQRETYDTDLALARKDCRELIALLREAREWVGVPDEAPLFPHPVDGLKERIDAALGSISGWL
jgi:hypothetical protein